MYQKKKKKNARANLQLHSFRNEKPIKVLNNLLHILHMKYILSVFRLGRSTNRMALIIFENINFLEFFFFC